MSTNEIMRIVFGVLCLVAGGLVVILIILNDLLVMVATLSISLGLLSVFLNYDAKVEKERVLQEEIRRKLTMIKLENESNLDSLEKLEGRIKKLYPPELKEKKLKQKENLKHTLFPEEIKEILKGKLWIQKQHCLYSFALQVVEIGHYFDNIFISDPKALTFSTSNTVRQRTKPLRGNYANLLSNQKGIAMLK